MPAKPKVTDEQFVEAYMAANGSYAETASYIQQMFDVPFTRQAALKRAKQFPNLKRQVLELLESDFDDHLLKFASDDTTPIWLRARIFLQLKNQLNKLNTQTQKTFKPPFGYQSGGYSGFDLDGNIITFTDDEHDKEALENLKKGLPGPGIEAFLEERRKKQEKDGLPD